jgi:hypothetical protein
VPRVAPGDLWSRLAHQWTQDVSSTIGFAVIGVIWMDHRSGLQRVGVADGGCRVVIRFVTDFLADYATAGGPDAHAVAVVDGTTMTVTSTVFMLTRVDVFRRRQLLHRCANPQVIRVATRVAARVAA